MAVRCPQCAYPSSLSENDIGANGRLLTCDRCGTHWLARSFDNDPYRQPGLSVLEPRLQEVEISDAIVVEDAPRSGRGRLPPPHWNIRAAATEQRERAARSNRRLMKVGGAILGALVALVVFRAPIVSALPLLPGANGLPLSADALEFRKVRSEVLKIHGVDTLFVDGEILNTSGNEIVLPAIQVTVKSPSGEEVTSWLVEPAQHELAGGGSIGFRSAFASPPVEASEITLNLARREGSPAVGLN